MSERWSYQIRQGFFFATMIFVVNYFFSIKEKSFSEELATFSFWVKFSVLLVFSIFVIGYLQWKTKQKGSEYAWSDMFRKKK